MEGVWECQSDNPQPSQRQQGCHRDDPYAWVYCNKTEVATKHVINAHLLILLLIPPPNEVGGGVYWIHLVHPSVRPSVRPSVCL